MSDERVDSEIGEAVGSAIGLRDPAAFQELASWTADWIRDHPKDAEEKLLAPLARARLVVGQTPVSAVEFALREEPQDKSEEAPQEKPERQPDFARELGSPTYVFGFLQRCDRVELAVAGLASSPRRSIEEDESGGGR